MLPVPQWSSTAPYPLLYARRRDAGAAARSSPRSCSSPSRTRPSSRLHPAHVAARRHGRRGARVRAGARARVAAARVDVPVSTEGAGGAVDVLRGSFAWWLVCDLVSSFRRAGRGSGQGCVHAHEHKHEHDMNMNMNMRYEGLIAGRRRMRGGGENNARESSESRAELPRPLLLSLGLWRARGGGACGLGIRGPPNFGGLGNIT